MNKTVICGLALALCGSAVAQQTAAPTTGKNPVVGSVRQIFDRQQKNIIAIAEEMPSDKYMFHPTDGQMPFAQIMSHIADSNGRLCTLIGGAPIPDAVKVKPEDGKDKIVAAVKASFDYCSTALNNVDDSKLGDEVTYFGGRKVPRAFPLIALTNDFADHYAAAAGYVRAAGMLPPNARPPQGQAAPAQKPPQ